MKKICKKQRKIDLEIMNKIATNSKFTKEDIDLLSEKIKKAAAKRFIEDARRVKCASQ